ncbi:unnamed protein product [Rhizophagus irregularis]|uniref:MATA-HMG n=1 Tax=Rhizophagus irregularis TaxID=588596 RepID=A0A1B1EVD4_9GLOM|nr:MATA-HMG [Rhizophagus irregularis]PKY38690.1 hypothetical protein RhiirA4_451734 [Rhizophagus irregularis]CAB4403110.1 unnamed protein product [Rhizophagus irregularis]
MSEIENLATSLINMIDRKNIFPPLFNNPESYISPVGPRTKKPPNSFLICRINVHNEAKRKGIYSMRVISKAASILWKQASSEEKDVYKKLSERVFEIYSTKESE